jgi:hypothetical protein
MIVALEVEYPSVWSRPVIRAVDTDIFRYLYFRQCLACGFCKDQCCNHGVDIDAANVERLLALGDGFESYIGLPKSEWFARELTEDDEFPSRRHMRTQTRNGKCVFHARSGRGCAIHAWSLDNGLDYHALKPMVSVLFPLTFEKGALVPSNEIVDGELVCAASGDTLYDGVRGELAWYFGDDLVRELDGIRDSLTSR